MLSRRREKLVRSIEALVERDPDRAAEELAANRRRLGRAESGRLAGVIRSQLHARDQVEYLSRGLAERTISPTSACELLAAYLDAGYLRQGQFGVLRRTVFEAHRREVLDLLSDSTAEAGDYFRLLDSYEAAGCLSEYELNSLGEIVEGKLNPAKAASRLFAQARAALDVEAQEAMLLRYLMEFEGFPDYGVAASEYIALKIDQLWRVLPTVRHARPATIAIHELNTLLVAYLPYTSDISLSVPIDQIFAEFLSLAPTFRPEPDVAGPITVRHLRQKVVVVEKQDASSDEYEYERNALIDVGSEGRVVAVRPHRVMISLPGHSLGYTKVWPQPGFEGSQYSRVHPGSSLSSWSQAELGLVGDSRPSPVFVHQYRAAVKRMDHLLEQHREDRSAVHGLATDAEGKAF